MPTPRRGLLQTFPPANFSAVGGLVFTRKVPRWTRGGRGLHLDWDPQEGWGDPRALPLLLRGTGPQADALRLARPFHVRPVRAPHHGRHAAVQALLPGRGEAATSTAHVLPEGVPHRG